MNWTKEQAHAYHKYFGYRSSTSFLRPPTRADLVFVPAPAPLPEPRFYRWELAGPTGQLAITRVELAGLLAFAAVVGFVFGYYLAF